MPRDGCGLNQKENQKEKNSVFFFFLTEPQQYVLKNIGKCLNKSQKLKCSFQDCQHGLALTVIHYFYFNPAHAVIYLLGK